VQLGRGEKKGVPEHEVQKRDSPLTPGGEKDSDEAHSITLTERDPKGWGDSLEKGEIISSSNKGKSDQSILPKTAKKGEEETNTRSSKRGT